MQGSVTGRSVRCRVAVLAFVFVVLAALSPAGAGAAVKKRPALSVAVASLSQKKVLKRKAVTLRVRSLRGGKVRVFASSKVRVKGALYVLATRSRDVKLRPKRARLVRLKMTRAGLRELSGCAGRRLRAAALPVLGVEKGTRPPVRSSRRLKVDRRACRGSATAGEQIPADFRTPADAGRCDFLDLAVCLQPWPNDFFTTPDDSKPTKRRLNLDLQSTPRNREGKPIDPADYNRNDGFSPGAMIVTKVPGLETKAAFDASRIVPVTDMGKAFARNQPVVLINTRTRGRALVWAELDANPSDPANVNLIVRPGRNLEEGTRYIVALRALRDAAGKPLHARPEFRLYRDRTLTTNKDVEARRDHFEGIFRTLAAAGIGRDGLYRAWDFTVASETNLTERMLAIRDDAFGPQGLGDPNLADLTVQGSSPKFTVTNVQENPNEKLARIVEGKVTVPCYLDRPGCPPGSRFLYPPGSTAAKPELRPIPGNTIDATFRCIIPKAAAGGGARASLYGHGLFGSRGEVEQGQLQDMANEHNFVFCATEWIGMSCSDVPDPTDPRSLLDDVLSGRQQSPTNCDVPNVVTILGDLSGFPTLVDRVQQGMLDFMFLGRAMIHPDGLRADPAFQLNGHPVFDDTQRLFYDGNSQGGIIGGSLIAVEPDLDRGVIGVPGMNYSTLLTRSTDFGTGKPPDPTDPGLPEYAYPLYQSYPNELERPLLFSMMQTLWDRGEANGYAHHMTDDPLPNTPAHKVLMQAGLGDHQVAQVAAETEARTIGARTHQPYVDAGRSFDVAPGFGLPRLSSYPFDGSAFTLFDIGPKRTEDGETVGTDPPPTTNTPPLEGQQDPHEFPRRSADARRQKDAFLRIGGQVIEVCGARPCYAGSWSGP